MENDISMYVAGYAGLRLAILAGFAYVFYRILRPAPALARIERQQPATSRKANSVLDDRC